MYQIDFTTPIHIHFIGIGGISMSGLAEILLEEGFTITGSDSKSPLWPAIWKKKVPEFIMVRKRLTSKQNQVSRQWFIQRPSIRIIRNLKALKTRTFPMLTRAELLGELMRNYKESVAVSELTEKPQPHPWSRISF